MPQITLNLPNPKLWLVFCSGVAVAGGLVILALILIHSTNRAQTILPTNLAENTPFIPYFFASQPPLGFLYTKQDLVYSQGVMSVKLHKPGSQDITISEQALPANLQSSDLLSGGERLSTQAGDASVNNVDGRYVGTIVSSDTNRTLILVSASSTGDRGYIVAMMQALRKAR